MSAHRQKFLAFRVYRSKDTDAYGELYDIHADRIRRFLIFKVPKKEDAEEITSEVFLRGWEYMTSSAVENVGALLFRIARNIVADFYRRSHPVEIVEDEVLEQVADTGSVAADVELKVETDDLVDKLKLLKDEYREILVMRYLNEMSIGEIAGTLEQTPNNVRVTLHRAKKALKEICVEPSITIEEPQK